MDMLLQFKMVLFCYFFLHLFNFIVNKFDYFTTFIANYMIMMGAVYFGFIPSPAIPQV